MGKPRRLRRTRVVAGTRPPRRPRWTKSEVALLKRLYKSHSNAEIADLLGRKVSSVVFKGHRLGLSKSMKRLREMGRENVSRRWQARRKSLSRGRGKV